MDMIIGQGRLFNLYTLIIPKREISRFKKFKLRIRDQADVISNITNIAHWLFNLSSLSGWALGSALTWAVSQITQLCTMY